AFSRPCGSPPRDGGARRARPGAKARCERRSLNASISSSPLCSNKNTLLKTDCLKQKMESTNHVQGGADPTNAGRGSGSAGGRKRLPRHVDRAIPRKYRFFEQFVHF